MLAPLLLALTPTAALPQDGPLPIRHVAAAEGRPAAPAPDFTLLDLDGEPWTLLERTREGYVLLVFVRGMW